jgi:hypothetical protein
MEPAQTTNIVDVYVNYLRRKLKDPPPGYLLRTVRGQGYMVPSETEMHLPIPLVIRGQVHEYPSGQAVSLNNVELPPPRPSFDPG